MNNRGRDLISSLSSSASTNLKTSRGNIQPAAILPSKQNTPLPKMDGRLFSSLRAWSICHRIQPKESHYRVLVDRKQGINFWGDLKWLAACKTPGDPHAWERGVQDQRGTHRRVATAGTEANSVEWKSLGFRWKDSTQSPGSQRAQSSARAHPLNSPGKNLLSLCLEAPWFSRRRQLPTLAKV